MKKILERFPWVQQAGCGVLICALLLSICLPLMGMRSAEPENPILDAAPQEITVLQAGQAPGHAGNGEAESKDAYGSGGSADSELTGEQEQPAPEETENQTEQGQDTQPEQQPKSKPQQEILADAAIGTNTDSNKGDEGEEAGNTGEADENLPETELDLGAVLTWYKYGSQASSMVCAPGESVGKRVLLAQLDGSRLRYDVDLTGLDADDAEITGVQVAAGNGVPQDADMRGVLDMTLPDGAEYQNYILTVQAHAVQKNQKGETVETDVNFAFVLRLESGIDLDLQLTWQPNGQATCPANGSVSRTVKSDTLTEGKFAYALTFLGENADDAVIRTAEYWATDGERGALSESGEIQMAAADGKDTETYSSSVYAWIANVVGLTDLSKKYECSVIYQAQSTASNDGDSTTIALTSRKQTGTQLPQVLLPGSAYENTITFRVTYVDENDGVTYYTDYTVALLRTLSLKNMEIFFQGAPVTLNRKGSSLVGYSSSENAYSILVPAAAPSLDVTFELHTDAPRYGDTDSGYEISVSGERVPSGGTLTAKLNGSEESELLTIELTNRNNKTAKTIYTIEVQKAATTAVTFEMTPADGQIYIYESISGNRSWPRTGKTYALSEGFTYTASFTCVGYRGQQAELTLEKDENGQVVLKLGEETFTDLHAVQIKLDVAEENKEIQHNLNAEWADFRGTSYTGSTIGGGMNSNNGITDAKTPITAESGMMYWAVKLGEGYSDGAVSNPILVDDCLIVYAGDHIYRVNKDTGAVEATGQMAGKSSFAINGPTYADGIVLVGLSNGRIQAFNAKTLESLWLYTDPLGGQPNCPITVLNGYAYTGFWYAEELDAGFVCVSLTDEDVGTTTEAKSATWRHVQNGGFYWAGAYACDDFIMVGTDDGKDNCSYLYLFDPLTGAILDSKSGFDGDIRSTISYDKQSCAYYFTSKGGTFYRVKVEAKNGSYAITACDGLKLDNGANDPALPPMSTSTPVVYNGRAYIGVSGTGQFTPYSGHNITVIDLGDTMSIAYSVPTQGYPQTSGLLTTAYDSYVYVYFFDNYTPGTLRALRDAPNQTSADYTTQELYKGYTYQAPYAIFTPYGDQAQYAICSPIADSNGTIYFKNDSAYLMAFGRSVETIKVTKQPDKTQYSAGETFDKTGMVVTATLSDGSTRDVTDMVSAPTGTLADGTTELTLEFGRGQTMYRNLPNGNKMTAGNKIAAITTTIQIRVGDTADSGTLADDITWSFRTAANTLSIDGEIPEGHKVLIACYDDSGKLTKLEVLTIKGSVTLPGSAKIRVFYIDGNSKPLCAAATVLG